MKSIFVFESDLGGRSHYKGAALHAREFHGARYGEGVGRTGDAYALPTKNRSLVTLPLETIKVYVADFLLYAVKHPELKFNVTRIGCGLAGYKDEDIAPLFRDAPCNCKLPIEWLKLYKRNI